MLLPLNANRHQCLLRRLKIPFTISISKYVEILQWHSGCWGLNKMDDILQTIFSNLFSMIKMFVFLLKFQWIVFKRIHPHNRHLSPHSPRLRFLFVNCATVNKVYLILAYLSYPVDNKSALVQVMAWCWTEEKLLPEPMITYFAEAYMHHNASAS